MLKRGDSGSNWYHTNATYSGTIPQICSFHAITLSNTVSSQTSEEGEKPGRETITASRGKRKRESSSASFQPWPASTGDVNCHQVYWTEAYSWTPMWYKALLTGSFHFKEAWRRGEVLYKNAILLELNRQTKITGQDNNNTGGGYCSC